MDKPFAITLDVGSSLANKTGAWRTNRPLYVDRLPPCNHACPAGENIQGWLYRAESGDYEAAWRTLTEENPLPAIMGRVCYHPCEDSCNRGKVDEVHAHRPQGEASEGRGRDQHHCRSDPLGSLRLRGDGRAYGQRRWPSTIPITTASA